MPAVEKTRRTRRGDDRELRRAQMLREAIRILGQRGYNGFTIQELAQRCGVTNGGLLYYFSSKEQLLLAVLQERDRLDKEFLGSEGMLAAHELARNSTDLKTVLDVMRNITIRDSLQPELVRLDTILRSEAIDAEHPAYEHFRARQTGVLDWVARLVKAHVSDSWATARQLIALSDGLTQQWLREDQDFDLIEEWDRAVANFLPQPGKPASRMTGPGSEPQKRK